MEKELLRKDGVDVGRPCAVFRVCAEPGRERKEREEGAERRLKRAGGKLEAGRARALKISGDYSLRDPPVPIPNTEVKPQLR